MDITERKITKIAREAEKLVLLTLREKGVGTAEIDLLRADGAWVYYEVPAENFFILTWMIDADKAAEKVASLKDEEGSLACIVDLSQEWHRA